MKLISIIKLIIEIFAVVPKFSYLTILIPVLYNIQRDLDFSWFPDGFNLISIELILKFLETFLTFIVLKK